MSEAEHSPDRIGDTIERPPIELPGVLPPWEQADLPEPLPWSFRNALRTIGPGAILLAGAIGGGEWFIGPTIAVKYGMGVFWIATLAIALQLVFNLEAIRYTLYTGEPIASGIMRLRPGSRFWAVVYTLLAVAQLGIPALASGSATTLFAMYANRMPQEGPADTQSILYITYGLILLVVAILMFGGTIERTLEYASWGMIAFIFAFLVTVNVLYVPWPHWWTTLTGFFQFGYIPAIVDPLLLAALAATAGSGGLGNLTISNWARDKGMGMGGCVGAIPSAVGSRKISLSHVGKVFPLTDENLRRWRLWWRYVRVDQIWLWGLGCFVGMFLNVNLATAIMPHDTNIEGIGAGAFQAKHLADQFWRGFWYLGLMNGFWILFSTHLSNTDCLVRTVTDMLWVASRRVRRWRGGNIAKIYYTLLLAFTAWGLYAVNWGNALQLFKVLGAMAGVVLALASVQVLIVNTRLLPKKLQPPLWRKAALAACALFYAIFSAIALFGRFV